MNKKNNLTASILYAMLFGAIFGLIIRLSPAIWNLQHYFSDTILNIGSTIFINLIKMLIVPLVFISLVCGICSLDDIKKLGRIGTKTLGLIILTTMIAIIWALIFANLFNVGNGVNLPLASDFQPQQPPSFLQFLIDIIPNNPVTALATGNILQIIVFAIFFGLAINLAGERGKRIATFFNDLNAVIFHLVTIVMYFVPVGVFCLIAVLFAKMGFGIILQLLTYFLTVVFVLLVHTVVTYGSFLKFLGKLKVKLFFSKLREVILFSFSVASSNASLPLTLETVEHKLGVDNSVASFVLSLGINMNKNGTAIMQAVATIFIAHAYQVDIGFIGNVMIVLTATLASISTAGVPSIGIFALVIVLKQLGLPTEGLALILTVDRLLDMLRTPVNVLSNAMIACLIGKSENKLNKEVYNRY